MTFDHGIKIINKNPYRVCCRSHIEENPNGVISSDITHNKFFYFIIISRKWKYNKTKDEEKYI